jgi:hypothetical protein
MKIIGFVEEPPLVEKILRHCTLWKEPAPRPPPAKSPALPVPVGPTIDCALLSLPFLKRKVSGARRRCIVPLSNKTAYDKSRRFNACTISHETGILIFDNDAPKHLYFLTKFAK